MSDIEANEKAETAEVSTDAEARPNARKVRDGLVVSVSMNKTVVIAVTDRVRHPRYRKTLQRTSKFYAHDETNDARLGDRVRIVETRPLSKLKRWTLVRVVIKAPSRQLAALEGAVAGATPDAAKAAAAKVK